MHPMANIALRAARLASDLVSRAFDRPDLLKISERGINDYVTNVDREAETLILETLQKTFSDHAFLTEERGLLGNTDSDYQWIIDPLDGTLNFLRGIPHFSISIASQFKGKVETAIIVDPIRREEFSATKGEGCFLNGHRLRVSKLDALAGSVIACGGQALDKIALQQTALYKQLYEARVIIRQGGSACLDLAYIAAGRVDALWLHNLKPWDMAAGVLLVTEAGGLVSDFEGGNHFLASGDMVAGTPKCFKGLLPLVKQHMVASRQESSA